MKRFFYFLIPALVLGGLIVWRFGNIKKDQQVQAQAVQARKTALPNVNVATATVRDILHTFDGVGSVESPFNVRIASKVTGLLDYLTLREGDHVTVGQVVARIDPSQVEAQVRQAQANVAEAQSRLAQAQLTTNPTNVGITSQISQQQATVSSAQANYEQAVQNYNQQVAAAQSAVVDAQGRVDAAKAAITNAQANIASAQSNLNNAQVKYNRTYSLYKQGFVAAQDVDDARTQMDVQKSALEVAQGQLNSAQASLNSAQAQKSSAQNQENIAVTKGKSDITAAAATVRQGHAGLELAQANRAQRPAYQANLAALKSAVAAAQAQLHDAQAQLSDTILRSSIDGYVTARSADPGTVVTAGQTILTLEALQQVYVTTTVPEEVSRYVFPGMNAQAVFDALPGRTFTGHIVQVNPAIDPQSRQFMVRVLLPNPHTLIKPGMFARVTFVTHRTNHALVVPREAVTKKKQGATVVVLDDQDVAHIRPVTTGDQDTTGIAITQGLQPGDRVVTLSLQPVRDGQKVRISPSALTPALSGAVASSR